MRPRDADRGNGEKCPEECAGGTRPSGPDAGRGPAHGARFRFFVLPGVVGGAYAIERALLAGVGRRDDGWRFRGERSRSPVVARARPGRAVLPARAVPVPGCPDLLRGPGACWSARGALPKRLGSADPRAARAGREGIGLFVRRRAVARATRAVVLRCARSYSDARGRTQMRAVVPWRPSNVRPRVTRYDTAQKGTTARPDVRPGAPTYDRAGPGRTEPPAPARRRPLTAAAHPDRTLEHEEPRFRTALSGRQGLARSSQAHRGPAGGGPSGAGAGAGRTRRTRCTGAPSGPRAARRA